MKAYVLLSTEPGKEAAVIDSLQGVKEITNIQLIYSIYDLIIEMEAESMDRLREVVFNDVRCLRHVRNTITLITYGEPVINE